MAILQIPFGAVTNSCRNCKAKCCRGLAVVLTIPEALRLNDAIGLDPDSYFELSDKVDSRKTPHFPLLYWEGKQLKEYFIIIKKRQNGDCFFLNENSTCGIYSVRPSVCRLYPFELTDSKKQKDGALCPKKFVREPQTDKEAEILEADLKNHGIAARRWNAIFEKKLKIDEMLSFFKSNII